MDVKQTKRKNILKCLIIILSVLLAVSLLLLAGNIIHKYLTQSGQASVKVPDNIITPEENVSDSQQTDGADNGTDGKTDDGADGKADSDGENGEDSAESADSEDSEGKTSNISEPSSAQVASGVTATALSLHNRQSDDNIPFNARNMLPGDSETKYYCVSVSHKGNVILRFHADIHPGYEKLAEVLKCRIVLPEKGEKLYDGLMRDMPKSLNHALNTDKSTTSEIYYEITAYLDTSVGNEYMEKDLIADFDWWVEETGELDAPQTGDNFFIILWIFLASGSLFLLALLWRKRKKEDADDER